MVSTLPLNSVYGISPKNTTAHCVVCGLRERVIASMSVWPNSMSSSARAMRSAPKTSRMDSTAVGRPGVLYFGFFPCQVPVHPPFKAFRLFAVGPVTRIRPVPPMGRMG